MKWYIYFVVIVVLAELAVCDPLYNHYDDSSSESYSDEHYGLYGYPGYLHHYYGNNDESYHHYQHRRPFQIGRGLFLRGGQQFAMGVPRRQILLGVRRQGQVGNVRETNQVPV